MGQQQLLLIVLGVIIVGIAIAVGINMFTSNAISSNRDAVTNDLNNLAAKLQQYYVKPVELGGGAHSFANVKDTKAAIDLGIWTEKDVQNGNGRYFVQTAGTASQIVIGGKGTEIAKAGSTDTVEVWCTVTATSIRDTVIH